MIPGRKTKRSFTASNESGAKSVRVEWEEIMVQITFAFVIILGYLVSLGLDEAKRLAAESEAHRRRGSMLETLIHQLHGTELGEARARQVQAERKLQLERLLRIWSQMRIERRLYELLRQFDRADFIPLDDDLPCLPTGQSFTEFNREIRRVFLSTKENVNPAEVSTLMKRVLVEAGYDPEAPGVVVDPAALPEEVAALFHDARSPTVKSLRMLRLQIVTDLESERRQLDEVQCALVAKIAAARRDKLAEVPLPETMEPEEEGDPGVSMLKRILDDLAQQMSLLPEAAARIRGNLSPASALSPRSD